MLESTSRGGGSGARGGVVPGGSGLGGFGLGGSGLGGCLVPGGVWCQGGYIPACTEADPPSCGQTDACENITFAQLRRGR